MLTTVAEYESGSSENGAIYQNSVKENIDLLLECFDKFDLINDDYENFKDTTMVIKKQAVSIIECINESLFSFAQEIEKMYLIIEVLKRENAELRSSQEDLQNLSTELAERIKKLKEYLVETETENQNLTLQATNLIQEINIKNYYKEEIQNQLSGMIEELSEENRQLRRQINSLKSQENKTISEHSQNPETQLTEQMVQDHCYSILDVCKTYKDDVKKREKELEDSVIRFQGQMRRLNEKSKAHSLMELAELRYCDVYENLSGRNKNKTKYFSNNIISNSKEVEKKDPTASFVTYSSNLNELIGYGNLSLKTLNSSEEEKPQNRTETKQIFDFYEVESHRSCARESLIMNSGSYAQGIPESLSRIRTPLLSIEKRCLSNPYKQLSEYVNELESVKCSDATISTQFHPAASPSNKKNTENRTSSQNKQELIRNISSSEKETNKLQDDTSKTHEIPSKSKVTKLIRENLVHSIDPNTKTATNNEKKLKVSSKAHSLSHIKTTKSINPVYALEPVNVKEYSIVSTVVLVGVLFFWKIGLNFVGALAKAIIPGKK